MAQILAVGISNGLFWFTPLVPALSLPPHVLLQEARLQVLLPYIHERPDQLALFVTWKLPKCYLPESAKRTVRKNGHHPSLTPPLVKNVYKLQFAMAAAQVSEITEITFCFCKLKPHILQIFAQQVSPFHHASNSTASWRRLAWAWIAPWWPNGSLVVSNLITASASTASPRSRLFWFSCQEAKKMSGFFVLSLSLSMMKYVYVLDR